jgi:hypothetical protein
VSVPGFEPLLSREKRQFFHERYWARIRWGIILGSV